MEEPLEKLRKTPGEASRFILTSLESGNIDDLYRRSQNSQRFQSVMASEGLDEQGLQESISLSSGNMYEGVNPDFLNRLTMIHNLFLKPPTSVNASADSVNVLAMFDTAHVDGEMSNVDADASQRTIFDCLDQKKESRQFSSYVIQGASSEMVIEKFQQCLIVFNKEIHALLS